MISKIKELRVSIDGLAQLTKGLKPLYKYKEIEKAVDSLYLSKAWLGKVLSELGTENPYKSGYKTKEDIVPTQDVDNDILKFSKFDDTKYANWNHIEKVDWLRQEIQKLIESLNRRHGRTLNATNEEHFNYNYWNAINKSYNYLCEVKFQLGFEFSRIKDGK